jgi:nicotinate phosphoribosyltransferase
MPSQSLLFTDFYQLTMVQLYFDEGIHEMPARFEYWFRRNPDYGTHQAGYGVFAGLDPLLDWMAGTQATSDDVEYLAGLRNESGSAVFSGAFLEWFAEAGNFGAVILEAIAEGRVVHPNVPLVIAEGPLAMVQILETPLLNILNHETLIATKASRIVEAARGRPVVDFGLRRAPGAGANAATRAALIGGAVASSNVEASRWLDIIPSGTHAHSMVQAFMAMGQSELDAFRAYARVYPDDCLLLVDTIDTLRSGIPNAITVFDELRADGHRPLGVRLDSGDLAYLAIESARLLDAAGHGDTRIVLSSSLDELAIFQILSQIEAEARRQGFDADPVIARLAFGVGSRMVSSEGHPALDGVCKLVAIRDGGEWRPAIKLSENPEKVANPGRKRVWRLYDERGVATADVLALEDESLDEADTLVLSHPTQFGVTRSVDAASISRIEPLHETVFAGGERRTERVPLDELRARRRADLERLDGGVRRLINPHVYHVSLSPGLMALKRDMIRQTRRNLAE